MSIRTIMKDGSLVAYQAIVGTGGKGNSKYFSVDRLGQLAALASAKSMSAWMEAAYVPKLRKAQLGNSNGVPGLRFEYMPSRDPAGTPILYAVATWNKNGVPCSSRCSTDRHGVLPSIEIVKKKREAGAGITIQQSAIELEPLMRKALA